MPTTGECLISKDAGNITKWQNGLYTPSPAVTTALVSIVDNNNGTVTATDNNSVPTVLNICAINDLCKFHASIEQRNFVVPSGGTHILAGSTTIPKTGKYLIREAGLIFGSNNSHYKFEMFINGNSIGQQIEGVLPATGWAGGHTFIHDLNAGDVLTFSVESVSGSLTVEVAAGDATFMGTY